MAAHRTGRLERLCGRAATTAADRIRIGRGARGIERLEAFLHGQAFSPHRHDTYAIGITVAGVQRFRFRAERWHCLPGQCHILHPDETHDGGAATEAGFGYRIAYIDPALVRAALNGAPLPFVANPVPDRARLPQGCDDGIWDIDDPLDEVAGSELVAAVADLLLAASGGAARQPGSLALAGLGRVRDAIASAPAEPHPMAALERASGLDRWTLARQFRAAFGTTPSRFRTMRQLDHVRRLLQAETSLAQASLAAGFADQSHMSRRFKRAYGLTPGEWVAACRR